MYKIAFFCQFDTRVNGDFFLNNYPHTNEYVKFRDICNELGYSVHTLDVYQKNGINPDICIFLDIPTVNVKSLINCQTTKAIAMLREPELVNSLNYDKKRHLEFDIILTWKQSLVDNEKYFFFPSTRCIKYNIDVKDYFSRRLCVLINSNLKSNIVGELYSERLKLIKWFEKNHLDDFDLYGKDWDKFIVALTRNRLLKFKLPFNIRSSYKGFVDNKLEIMSKYKFAICFENSGSANDYVSEKIFDCFLSKSVPIYWGAPNIAEIVPKDCFMDFRRFKNYESMFQYIKNMEFKEYMEYIENIKNYLNSKLFQTYSLDNWIDCLLKTINILKNRKDYGNN